MKIKSVILLFIFSNIAFDFKSQNCDCKTYAKARPVIDSLMEIADYDKANQLATDFINGGSAYCKAIGYGYVAEILAKKNSLDSAKKCIKESEIIFNSLNCLNDNMYRFLSQSAECAFYENNYELSLNLNLKALQSAKNDNNNTQVAQCYVRVANIFIRMGQSEKARYYSVLAKNVIDKLPESYKKYQLYNILANRYNNLYQDFKEPKFLDTIEFFMSGIRMYALKAGKYNRLIEQYYRKKAFLSLKTKDFTASLKYLDSASEVLKNFPLKFELYSIHGDRANIYRKLKQFKTAELFADSCLLFALKDNIVSSITNAYDIVYMVAKDAGKSDKALWAFENLKHINDSIIGIKNTSKIIELEQKYNKVQNEKTIKELNQETEIKNLRIRILIIAIALSALLIIVIIFFYRQSTIKNKQKILETEQRLNRSRINPHFFFNAITTLQGLAVKENDGKKIATSLFKFSSLMRQTLESSYTDYLSIDEELEFINKYVELQQLKEENKFSIEFYIDPEIETSEILIPAMLIQPFLENSIEHGFNAIKYKGLIHLKFALEDKAVRILVSDNGQGFKQNEPIEKKHISRAMQITKDRLYLLNKGNKGNASFSVKENKPNGIVVDILLPLIYK